MTATVDQATGPGITVHRHQELCLRTPSPTGPTDGLGTGTLARYIRRYGSS
ncbi:hypothetical protein [Streptomyces abyssomicinicus]|uniref:hypothetical protein n=1 Tax=Streptomyces abyssomicinicus TaxID=574929 RepID=UPI0013E07766|nr:hypothetical protein [Streptomyces abyssomicinicus]